MIIAGGRLDRAALAGDVVIVTGGGSGIGFEAARSLLYLGARVVVAEIDATSGRNAELQLAAESASDRVMFVPTDVSDERSVQHLCEATLERFGSIDVVLNKATYAPSSDLHAPNVTGLNQTLHPVAMAAKKARAVAHLDELNAVRCRRHSL
jgi:NAD(P)-dependent dehydrogenase (short-subunit alcohol dehydrogenase family)